MKRNNLKAKDLYALYLKDHLWLIKEAEWSKDIQDVREAQFSLGNGYIGVRGVLEGIPYDSSPGTYIAGVYDNMGSQVDELVNLPNPINFRITVKGEKLDLIATKYLEHNRVLNTKKGLLLRKTVYQDTKERSYSYQSLRFMSMAEKNIGAMQVSLSALDGDCIVDINTGIDTSVANAGVLSEGRKRHFRVKELGQSHNAGYLVVETLEKRYTVVYWSGFYYEVGGKKKFAKDNIFRLKLKKGETVVFTKIFCIKHFSYKANHDSYKNAAFKIFYRAFHASFSNLIESHIRKWENLWKKADIAIEGTANIQQNLRFNIYHMLICGNFDKGFSSIGARTLSGEGYRGHIFWDADIFVMPFYLFTFPKMAQNMLLYRCRRIEKYKELAKQDGFKGARFSWESAASGDEETPQWAKDFDGTVIKIYTHKLEQHITADVAYAVYRYYVATEDEDFMRNYGYSLFFETARFWASRVKYNKAKNKYGIDNVIGPDEFHIGVNNNAYTNMMAKWNLLTAHRLFFKIKADSFGKKIKNNLELTEKEVNKWKRISSKMHINFRKDKVIEQFDGYFRLKDVALKKTDENGIPLLPNNFKAKDLGKTQLVKQADVLMLLYLLDDVFTLKTKESNYDFYIKRTLHKSSLSPSIHDIVASSAGDLHRAYNLFNVALRTDISNLYGNTKEGIHAASLGGVWQAVVFGFAGVKIRKEKLFIDPKMPHSWRKVSLSLNWKKGVVKLELIHESIKLRISSSSKEYYDIGIFGRLFSLETNKVYIFNRKASKFKKEYYY